MWRKKKWYLNRTSRGKHRDQVIFQCISNDILEKLVWEVGLQSSGGLTTCITYSVPIGYPILKELQKALVNKEKISIMKRIFVDKPWVIKTPIAIRNTTLIDIMSAAYRSNLVIMSNSNITISFKKKRPRVVQLIEQVTRQKRYFVFLRIFFYK